MKKYVSIVAISALTLKYLFVIERQEELSLLLMTFLVLIIFTIADYKESIGKIKGVLKLNISATDGLPACVVVLYQIGYLIKINPPNAFQQITVCLLILLLFIFYYGIEVKNTEKGEM